MSEPEEPTEHTEPNTPDRPLGRSHYEDFDLSATPPPQRASRRRTPTLTVAAIVLGVSGVLKLLTAFFLPIGETWAIALGVLGVLELAATALVAMLHPLGRPVGIALGFLGLVVGLLSARSSPANGLVTMGLNGFVVYALASSGAAFRRE